MAETSSTIPPSSQLQETVIVSKKQDQKFRQDISQLYYSLQENSGADAITTPTIKVPHDVVILCHKKEFKAHKLIVVQNSKFLYDQIVSAKGSEVVKVDVTPLVPNEQLFDKLLKYMYTGELPIKLSRDKPLVDPPTITVKDPSNGEECLILLDDIVNLLIAAYQLGMPEICQVVRAYMGTFLTFDDACEIIEEALEKKHFHLYEICVKIIEHYSDRVFKGETIMKSTKQNMIYFLQSGNLSLQELELFEAALRWCQYQIDHNPNLKGKSLKEVFSDLEPYIRYPFIDAVDLIEKVEPTGMVSEKYLTEAFKYGSLPQNVRDKYVDNIRTKPRKTSCRFVFKKQNLPANVEVSENGLEAKLNVDYSSRSICADLTITKSGIYYWEIEVTSPQTGNCMVMIGVADPNTMGSTAFLSHNAKGYAIYLHTGDKYYNSRNDKYAPPGGGTGTKVGVMVEMKNGVGNLYFSVNGESKGLAYSDIPSGVCPAITLYRKDECCKILPSQKVPPLSFFKNAK